MTGLTVALALTGPQIRGPVVGVVIAFGSAKIWRDGVLWTKNKRIVGTPAKVIACIGFAIAIAMTVVPFLLEPTRPM